MRERFAVSIELKNQQDGSLGLRVQSTEEHTRLRADSSTIVVTMWTEADGTVRARLEDVLTGVIGYLQGNETMLRFGGALGLAVYR